MKLKIAPVQIYEKWTVRPELVSRKRLKVKFWTETEIALAIDLYNRNYTAKEIASQLPKRTKAAVAAKIQSILHDQELFNSQR